MLKKTKIILLCSALLMILIVVIGRFGYHRHNLSISENSILWTKNSASTEMKKITVRGTYVHGFLTQEKFQGKIEIEGITDDLDFTETSLCFLGHGYALLDYIKFENGQVTGCPLGHICFNHDFSMFSIFLNRSVSPGGSMTWNSELSEIISYPAKSRDQAVSDTVKLCKSNWLAKVEWE